MKAIINFKSIKTKLLFGFAVVLFLLVILSGYNYYVLSNVNKTTSNILHKELPLLIADDKLAAIMYDRMGSARGYIISGDSYYKEQFNEATEDSELYQSTIKKLNNSNEFEELVENTIEWRNYIIAEVFNEYDQGNKDLAMENLLNADDYVRALAGSYEELALNREKYLIGLEEEILWTANDRYSFDFQYCCRLIWTSYCNHYRQNHYKSN